VWKEVGIAEPNAGGHQQHQQEKQSGQPKVQPSIRCFYYKKVKTVKFKAKHIMKRSHLKI